MQQEEKKTSIFLLFESAMLPPPPALANIGKPLPITQRDIRIRAWKFRWKLYRNVDS
jgi:hypothetical protein